MVGLEIPQVKVLCSVHPFCIWWLGGMAMCILRHWEQGISPQHVSLASFPWMFKIFNTSLLSFQLVFWEHQSGYMSIVHINIVMGEWWMKEQTKRFSMWQGWNWSGGPPLNDFLHRIVAPSLHLPFLFIWRCFCCLGTQTHPLLCQVRRFTVQMCQFSLPPWAPKCLATSQGTRIWEGYVGQIRSQHFCLSPKNGMPLISKQVMQFNEIVSLDCERNPPSVLAIFAKTGQSIGSQGSDGLSHVKNRFTRFREHRVTLGWLKQVTLFCL